MPIISICVPTYNRAKLLSELLDSILDQENVDDVEIVISDDASTDDTMSIADSYLFRFKHYKFIAQPINLGMDGNFLAVVAAATSPYIWLMGDDDRLEPGSIRRLLDAIELWPDAVGFTLGVIDYDVTMSTAIGLRATPTTQLMTGSRAVFSSIADLLGFMSALVVKRDLWIRELNDPKISSINNYYIQVIILGRIIGENGQWGVIQPPCVGFRAGNDQLQARYGWLERLKIDAKAYDQIAQILFADSPQTRNIMRRRIFDTHIMARIMNAKTTAEPTVGIMPAALFLARTYGKIPAYWTIALPLLLTPNFLVRFFRGFYRTYFKSSGRNRASLNLGARSR
ncbi:glycosyltransferase family 2 protein [Ancylobacter sp. FA202]|uniref:glycosyltransferase family 2 protein n=1 Tax=Ancylobacter sp. FA202 TaxID=1111106 RepID=UPI0003A486E9|nr:glycosyltransferase family 2 protein [Ancylobacter sp. FA202]